ncbi:Imm71 family immunity protein [Dyella japonica]|uniref:Immunity protein 72 of polymorphic toxin system n=1 Tax=Dyella japonica TaxID=231455 RepID=A0ABV2K1F0_9GAMM
MSSAYPSGVMLPTEQERQRIFYWLKRISSYTAWNRILGYYRIWAKATERSLQKASERGWLRQRAANGRIIGGVRTGQRISDGIDDYYDEYTGSEIGESTLISVLKGMAHCEEGVRRLRLGDKRVFKYDVNGEFVMAYRPQFHWVRRQSLLEIREIVVDADHTPYWDEFNYTLTQLSEAWGECSSKIIEREDLNAPSSTIYGVWLQEWLPKMTFPKVLPEVPDPAKHTLIATGKITPCSGIWEPVEVPKSKGFHLFGNAPPPEGPLPIIGCMAYLHGGSPAPRAKQETETESLRADVIWRLLWRDDRYEDGTVPEEESAYVFLKPDPSSAAPEPEELRGGLRVWSDTPCPYPGVWQCLDKPLGPQTVAFGVPMPRVQGERVLWRLMRAV